MELNLLLPVPTSINKLYINEYQYQKNPVTKKPERVPTGRRILSTEGRKVKAQIQGRARVQLLEQPEWDYEWTKENFVYQDAVIYFARRGSDDNNIYKLLNDSLEGITYDNDSRVLVRTQRIVYDSKNPRIEVKITPVEFVGIFENKDVYDEFEAKCEFGGVKGCSKYRKGSCSILKDSIAGTVREEIGSIHNPICTAFKEKK
ncbi:hypothetical protein BSK59_16255 [Paenibacillus odorifer]|uniref:RusA family crossover junction endodeoxyribonuclease n=1 Tax=Paenibacillus odorifer TaxID=189426 RepID=UPI00096EACD1|nr:RusA family crossover junction endodeoxyribonuclease [Paenibacillus odorifer]OME54132.1 hypothetical protein BSK59_16255 [Paenibacillus odorifer]